jgi:hypothetical protein
MAKRTRYSEYHDRYANYRLELSDDGILFMQCHTNGGSLVWDWRAHDDLSDVFADIAGDREIKVLIHTGTGENYNANWGRMPNGDRVEKPEYLLMPGTRGLVKLDEKAWYARHLITNVLDVDVPMISAVNGPCNMHSRCRCSAISSWPLRTPTSRTRLISPAARCPATANTSSGASWPATPAPVISC